jgi:hypothetical protein
MKALQKQPYGKNILGQTQESDMRFCSATWLTS